MKALKEDFKKSVNKIFIEMLQEFFKKSSDILIDSRILLKTVM